MKLDVLVTQRLTANLVRAVKLDHLASINQQILWIT